MSVTLQSDSEPPYRISIKTTTKNHHHWDITIRGEDKVEAEGRLKEAVALAKETCEKLNAEVTAP